MRDFAKDYVELCREVGKFYKKHWKGVALLDVAIIGAEFVWYKSKAKKAK